jgi:hypothetical protein
VYGEESARRGVESARCGKGGARRGLSDKRAGQLRAGRREGETS